MKRLFSLYFIIILTITVGSGCGSKSNKIINLALVKEQIKDYHKSGKYDAVLKKIISKAEIEFSKITSTKNSLVVFDIDETSLSNYEFALEYDFGYNEEIWTKWVIKKKATAIKEVREFYKFLIAKGFKTAFITGRNTSHYEATIENLINQGYTKFDTVITRKMNDLKTTALEYKSNERKLLEEKGYEIVGTIGDQFSDLRGSYHGIQIKLPNYQYIVK